MGQRTEDLEQRGDALHVGVQQRGRGLALQRRGEMHDDVRREGVDHLAQPRGVEQVDLRVRVSGRLQRLPDLWRAEGLRRSTTACRLRREAPVQGGPAQAQHRHRGVALEPIGDQPASNEPLRARHQDSHRLISVVGMWEAARAAARVRASPTTSGVGP